MSKKTDYPYLYFGHGAAFARKEMECTLVFKSSPSPEIKSSITNSLPELMSHFSEWEGRIFTFGHVGFLQIAVKDHYKDIQDLQSEFEEDPDLSSVAQWLAFNQDIDIFIQLAHQKEPLLLAFKPIDIEYPTETDSWHEWSLDHFLKDIFPLRKEMKKHENIFSQMAYEWFSLTERKPVKEKKIILKTLSSEDKLWLKKEGFILSTKEKPIQRKPPTLDEFEKKIWPLLNHHPTGRRMEDAFMDWLEENNVEEKEDETLDLETYAELFFEKGEYKKGISLSCEVLSSGAEIPSHWQLLLLEKCLALNLLEEAKEQIKPLVWQMEFYEPELIQLFMDYYRKLDDFKTESMLYHAGKKWFTAFSYYIPKKEAEKYGKPPKDLKELFSLWIKGWMQADFLPEKILHPSHFCLMFEDIGGSIFKPWIEALGDEIRRRSELFQALEKSKNKKECSKLILSILEFTEYEGEKRLLMAALALEKNHPDLAFSLYKHALKSISKNGFYNYSVARCASNILSITLKDYPAGREEALELATPYAHLKGPILSPWLRYDGEIFHQAFKVATALGDKSGASFYYDWAIRSGYKEGKV